MFFGVLTPPSIPHINIQIFLQVKKLRHQLVTNDTSLANNDTSWSSEMSAEALAEFHSQIQERSEQPEIKAMILHQASTIAFTLFGNLLMVFVIMRHNTIKKRRKMTPVQVSRPRFEASNINRKIQSRVDMNRL